MTYSPKVPQLVPDLKLKPWSSDSKSRTFSRAAWGRGQSKKSMEGGGRILSFLVS